MNEEDWTILDKDAISEQTQNHQGCVDYVLIIGGSLYST